MVKLKKINLYLLDYPLKNYVVTSFGLMKSRPALILELTDTNENIGLGEIWCNFPSDGPSYKFKLFKSMVQIQEYVTILIACYDYPIV